MLPRHHRRVEFSGYEQEGGYQYPSDPMYRFRQGLGISGISRKEHPMDVIFASKMVHPIHSGSAPILLHQTSFA